MEAKELVRSVLKRSIKKHMAKSESKEQKANYKIILDSIMGLVKEKSLSDVVYYLFTNSSKILLDHISDELDQNEMNQKNLILVLKIGRRYVGLNTSHEFIMLKKVKVKAIKYILKEA